jgi:ABC-2 type transport system ATP-binding protein
MTESSTANPTAPVLKLDGVVKRYREKTVLDGATLDVPAGSVLGLLGKNGAGKTTLLKAALGLIKPDSGTATLLGEPAWSLSADAKARLGYVPQTVTLYPWMRVRQVIDYTAAFYPQWNMALVWQLIKDWEVGADDKVGNLSVGTLQKLAIILALGPEPQLLVLDEPAASLDPAARRDFLKALLDIAVNGTRTIVFSTHITSDLERVADRVAILRGGQIAYDGELDELTDAVKRLHVTAKRPLSPSFNVPGAMRLRVEGNEALVSIHGASDEMLESIRKDYDASVRVEDLNLEDIFLEMHQG